MVGFRASLLLGVAAAMIGLGPALPSSAEDRSDARQELASLTDQIQRIDEALVENGQATAELNRSTEAYARKVAENNTAAESVTALNQRLTERKGQLDAEHASVFFGRSEDVTRAIDRLKAAVQRKVSPLQDHGAESDPESAQPREDQPRGNAFLLVVGASGAGKSSLVRAGLVPRLTTPGVVSDVDKWRVAIMRPGDAGTVVDALNQLPGFTVGGNAGTGGQGTGGRATINLHGLGTNRNLVLLDGKRLPISDISAMSTRSRVSMRSASQLAIFEAPLPASSVSWPASRTRRAIWRAETTIIASSSV